MKKNYTIPHPNKLSIEELKFLQESKKNDYITKNTYKGRMISMSDEFYYILNQYLKNNPTEGNRSSFIVRIVADYIKKRNFL